MTAIGGFVVVGSSGWQVTPSVPYTKMPEGVFILFAYVMSAWHDS